MSKETLENISTVAGVFSLLFICTGLLMVAHQYFGLVGFFVALCALPTVAYFAARARINHLNKLEQAERVAARLTRVDVPDDHIDAIMRYARQVRGK